MPDTVWTTGCTSWYIGPDGNPELWRWNPRQHRIRLSEINPTAHDLRFDVARATHDV
jgi:hypothetical protein